MTKIIGITGGIGSGKTTVCKIFESLGIPVYNADVRAKYLMNHDVRLKGKIKSLLGKEAYHRNGRLNKAFVAKKIFNNKELLAGINAIVHPAVHHDAALWAQNNPDAPYLLYEAALLVENGSYKNFYKIIVVTAPEALRIARVMKRDGIEESAVRARMKNQLPDGKKTALADYIINNDENESILQAVVRIHRDITTDKNE
jgi:dephospho-CoA kinase